MFGILALEALKQPDRRLSPEGTTDRHRLSTRCGHGPQGGHTMATKKKAPKKAAKKKAAPKKAKKPAKKKAKKKGSQVKGLIPYEELGEGKLW
jgi:hypothetical protein